MNRLFVKTYLLLTGGVAAGLGAMILLVPVEFYSGYGLELGGKVNLLNELRSHGLSLFAVGVLIAAGAFIQRLATVAAIVATGLYLTYGLSRLVGVALDGIPSNDFLVACAVEIIIGLTGLALVLSQRRAQANV